MLPPDGAVVWCARRGRTFQGLVVGREWPRSGPPLLLVLEQRDGVTLPGILRVPIANVRTAPPTGA